MSLCLSQRLLAAGVLLALSSCQGGSTDTQAEPGRTTQQQVAVQTGEQLKVLPPPVLEARDEAAETVRRAALASRTAAAADPKHWIGEPGARAHSRPTLVVATLISREAAADRSPKTTSTWRVLSRVAGARVPDTLTLVEDGGPESSSHVPGYSGRADLLAIEATQGPEYQLLRQGDANAHFSPLSDGAYQMHRGPRFTYDQIVAATEAW
jgi:hypothetical protein